MRLLKKTAAREYKDLKENPLPNGIGYVTIARFSLERHIGDEGQFGQFTTLSAFGVFWSIRKIDHNRVVVSLEDGRKFMIIRTVFRGLLVKQTKDRRY